LFPRFFGITKTFRPVFSPAAAEPGELADADDAAADDVVPEVDGELDDEHAASRIDATANGTARPAVCLSFIS
jgi:hypothetical protein